MDINKATEVELAEVLSLSQQAKGKGYGRMAVEKLFDEKKGQYFVIQVENNKPAVVFWRKVLQTSSLDLNEEKCVKCL